MPVTVNGSMTHPDGACTDGQCDCGSQPCGEYLLRGTLAWTLGAILSDAKRNGVAHGTLPSQANGVLLTATLQTEVGGEPSGLCIGKSAGVFVCEYSKVSVRLELELDCEKFEADHPE